jgi:phosphoribosylamine--glycine ligase
MNVLLVDRSGRGHSFADAFIRTNSQVTIHYAPGCAAVDGERIKSAQHLRLSDHNGLVEYAKSNAIDFAFVTNAAALADGVVDSFRSSGVAVIGPDREASRLESSKIFAKALFTKYGIPTPAHKPFDDAASARSFVRSSSRKLVVKADGLCGGNGAFVCDSVADAEKAIDLLMIERVFGESGDRILIEERVYGKEFSFFALLDGENYLVLPMAVDYKKSHDANGGVNSGGMGALSHHPLECERLVRKVKDRLIAPILRLIKEEGLKYCGPIYLGCILVGEEPVLLEINARMGDPESEVVLPRIETDFVDICGAILERRLNAQPIRLNGLHFCDVVATQGPTAARNPSDPPSGYPGWPFGAFSRHHPISGLNQISPEECRVFIGEATVLPDLGLVSDGGRVVHVVGFGHTAEEAAQRSLRGVRNVRFEGVRYRTDIGTIMPWD